jgi:hypothetical protein
MSASEIYHALSRPWAKGEVKERKGPGGKMLSYVDARQVQNRLDEVVGTENWQTHFSEVCGNYCCTLSVKIDGEWIAKSDGAGETSIEATKAVSVTHSNAPLCPSVSLGTCTQTRA